ncbi:MAG: hypothetical protein AAF242_15270, partial [Bacteroidota bacterium]
QEDPLSVYLMIEEAPKLQPGMRVVPRTEKEGSSWNACLVFSQTHGRRCAFYKHCLKKGCRTQSDAQILAEYGQDTTLIQYDKTTDQDRLELNLN